MKIDCEGVNVVKLKLVFGMSADVQAQIEDNEVYADDWREL
ncbi:MAG: hypothetical protein ACT6FE_07000 [Methanosarcinaceae archaeon]